MATYLPAWKPIPVPYRIDPATEIHRMDVVYADDSVRIYWAGREQLLLKQEHGEWWTSRPTNVWPTPRVQQAESLLTGLAV